MTNKKMWNNSNIQEGIEWGNVELPGLTDEELYKKNWNISESQKQRFKNLSEEEKQAHRQKIIDRDSNPKYVKKIRDKYYDNPEYKKVLKQRAKEVANRPENLKWYKEFNSAKRQDLEHIKRHQEAVDKRTQDPDWIAKQQARRKKIQTPDGIFESRKHAAEFYNVKPPTINGKIKRFPDKYYYIE